MLITNDHKYFNIIKIWILASISLIMLMIIVGGLTRLTDSGLSITEWNLFNGILPPITNLEWQYYFSLYKEIPQFKLINKDISLQEFKVIFYWEYFHRLLGRVIGLFFVLPLLLFTFKKIFNITDLIKLYSILVLICFQGFLGWYMVQSGLTNNVTVSHYRLSIHLFLAFILLSSLVWIFFNLINSTNKNFFYNFSRNKLIKFLIILIFSQIIIGAFVSGLDAGRIYQTWPMMNESFFPNDLKNEKIIHLFNFSNHSFVQFFHRTLAYIIFLASIIIGYNIFKNKITILYKSYLFFFIILLFQIFLGIVTLLSGLSIYLASLHQISSILLIIFTLRLHYKSL